MIFDVEPVLHHFFDYIASDQRYKRPLLAQSTVMFLSQNVNNLIGTNIFSTFYPTIFKLLVWHPRVLKDEIL